MTLAGGVEGRFGAQNEREGERANEKGRYNDRAKERQKRKRKRKRKRKTGGSSLATENSKSKARRLQLRAAPRELAVSRGCSSEPGRKKAPVSGPRESQGRRPAARRASLGGRPATGAQAGSRPVSRVARSHPGPEPSWEQLSRCAHAAEGPELAPRPRRGQSRS